MALTKKRLAKELVRAHAELRAARLRDRIEGTDVIALRVPGVERPILASMTGAEGGEFGLELRPDDENPWTLTAATVKLRDLPREHRAFVELGGFRGRRESDAPFFGAERPGGRAGVPNRDEAEILLFGIRGILKAAEEERLDAEPIGDGGDVPLLELWGDARRPGVKTGRVELTQAAQGAVPADPGGEGGGPGLPAPDDLKAWKEADLGLTDRSVKLLERDLVGVPRSLARYLGSKKEAARLLKGKGEEDALAIYVAWFFTFHRDRPGGPTNAESLLSGTKLTRTERALVKARIAGRVSVYRILETGDDARVRLLDILDGTEYEVRDRSFAAREVADVCIPMNLFAAGDFLFPEVLGPTLSTLEANEALDSLEEEVGPLTPDRLQRESYVLGHLWRWFFKARAQPRRAPLVLNADGDQVRLVEASYALDDPDAFTRAVGSRDDIVPESEQTLVWIGATGDAGPLPGARTVLANLVRTEHGFTLNTNSTARLDRARDWIDRIPGAHLTEIRFLTDEPEQADPPPPEGAMPGRVMIADGYQMDADADPERDLEEVRREQELALALAWLDTAVPVLDGRTPRETCATEDGRRRVKRMILTMPRPIGEAGARRPPFEAMLDELGLAEGDLAGEGDTV